MMPRLIAFLCLLLLALAVAMTLRGSSPFAPEPPRAPARASERLSAALTPIGPLDEFSPNEENPFVPVGEGRSPQEKDTSTPNSAAADESPSDPKEDPLPLARGRAVDATVPICMGRVVHGPSGDQALIIRHRSSQRALRLGDELSGWHLLGIEPGAARFRAPDGREVGIACPAR